MLPNWFVAILIGILIVIGVTIDNESFDQNSVQIGTALVCDRSGCTEHG